MATKICFGLSLEAAKVAQALGVRYGDVKSKKCVFCGKDSPPKANFCWNCGSSTKMDASSVGPAEVVELALRKNPPPRSLTLIPHEQDICVCQVLGASESTLAMFDKPVAHFPWTEVGAVISAYAASIGNTSDGPRPFLFAIHVRS